MFFWIFSLILDDCYNLKKHRNTSPKKRFCGIRTHNGKPWALTENVERVLYSLLTCPRIERWIQWRCFKPWVELRTYSRAAALTVKPSTSGT